MGDSLHTAAQISTMRGATRNRVLQPAPQQLLAPWVIWSSLTTAAAASLGPSIQLITEGSTRRLTAWRFATLTRHASQRTSGTLTNFRPSKRMSRISASASMVLVSVSLRTVVRINTMRGATGSTVPLHLAARRSQCQQVLLLLRPRLQYQAALLQAASGQAPLQ